MPYNLHITSVEGREFTSLRSPYDNRDDITRTVKIILADKEKLRVEDVDFAQAVRDAELGDVVRHSSGVAFRTEEVQA